MSKMTTKSTMNCCLCDDAISGWGNNPYPLCAADDHKSRCCDSCNIDVIIARLKAAQDEMPKPPPFDADGDDWMYIYSERPVTSWDDHPELVGGIYYQCWGGGPSGGYVKKGSALYHVNKAGFCEPWVVEKQEKKRLTRIVKDDAPYICVW